MRTRHFVCTATTLVLFMSVVTGWLFDDDKKPRPLDGSLRCYQCDSTKDYQKVCRLNDWKHANITEKRNMTMQCPRRKSAFCHLVLAQDERDVTIRGCTGPTHSDGRTAHNGCFKMQGDGFTNRVCLCDSDLCNRSPQMRVDWAAVSFTTLAVVLYGFYGNSYTRVKD